MYFFLQRLASKVQDTLASAANFPNDRTMNDYQSMVSQSGGLQGIELLSHQRKKFNTDEYCESGIIGPVGIESKAILEMEGDQGVTNGENSSFSSDYAENLGEGKGTPIRLGEDSKGSLMLMKFEEGVGSEEANKSKESRLLSDLSSIHLQSRDSNNFRCDISF